MEEQERQVKGIWIPIEIWKNKELSWNEKILFLEIDSFTSKDKDCYISNEYISKLLGVSETNANKILSSLIKKGFVIKTSFDGRRRFVKSALIHTTMQTCQERQPCIVNNDNIPNTYTNNNILNKEDKDKSLSKKDTLFEECWLAYRRKGSKAKAKTYWDKLGKEEKPLIMPHILAYVSANPDLKYTKDFERYLRDKIFMSIVYKNNVVIYDPDRVASSNEYHPQEDINIFWNEPTNSYITFYNPINNDMFADGYNDCKRPDKAKVRFGGNNFVWSSEFKKWRIE